MVSFVLDVRHADLTRQISSSSQQYRLLLPFLVSKPHGVVGRLTPGPIPLVFALVVVYYAIVPPSKPRYFGVLGLDFSDKAFTFVVAGMVRKREEQESSSLHRVFRLSQHVG